MLTMNGAYHTVENLLLLPKKIIWGDGEEIHLRFPEKVFNQLKFYDSISDLLHDFEIGHDISFNEGFDISADSIDLVKY